jgi:hypothetical protein
LERLDALPRRLDAAANIPLMVTLVQCSDRLLQSESVSEETAAYGKETRCP